MRENLTEHQEKNPPIVLTMPDIVIRCPMFEKVVPTGLTTEQIKLDSLSDLVIPLRCPACQKLHKWRRKDAWVVEPGK